MRVKAVVLRLAGRLLVLALAWVLTPGLAEVTENVWHLAVAGHTAHAAGEGADHVPEDAEHGCNGTFHVCSCHHTPASDLVPAPALRLADPGRELALFRSVDAPEPPLPRLDRPPRA